MSRWAVQPDELRRRPSSQSRSFIADKYALPTPIIIGDKAENDKSTIASII